MTYASTRHNHMKLGGILKENGGGGANYDFNVYWTV